MYIRIIIEIDGKVITRILLSQSSVLNKRKHHIIHLGGNIYTCNECLSSYVLSSPPNICPGESLNRTVRDLIKDHC